MTVSWGRGIAAVCCCWWCIVVAAAPSVVGGSKSSSSSGGGGGGGGGDGSVVTTPSSAEGMNPTTATKHRDARRLGGSSIWDTLENREHLLNLYQGPPLQCLPDDVGEEAVVEAQPELVEQQQRRRNLRGKDKQKSEPQHSRLDVVLIVGDGVDPFSLSCYNTAGDDTTVAIPEPYQNPFHALAHTPHIDALASGGAMFTQAYSPHPACSPGRFAILTGRYASHSRRAVETSVKRSLNGRPALAHIAQGMNAWVVRGTRTLGHAFRALGWTTALTGKWDVSSSIETRSFTTATYGMEWEEDRQHRYAREYEEVKEAGFDHVFALYPTDLETSSAKTFGWAMDPTTWTAEDQEPHTAEGPSAQQLTSQQRQHHPYHRQTPQEEQPSASSMPPSSTAQYTHNPEYMAVESIAFMDEMYRQNTPFFLFFALTLAHVPEALEALLHSDPTDLPDLPLWTQVQEVQSGLHGELRDAKLEAMRNMRSRVIREIEPDLAKYARVLQQAASSGSGLSINEVHSPGRHLLGFDTSLRHKHHVAVATRWVDLIVGELVEHIQKRHRLDSTIIVFTSDHGLENRRHCLHLGLRVPFVVHAPGIVEAQQVVDKHVVSTIDILPTLSHMVRVKGRADETRTQKSDGGSDAAGRQLVDGCTVLPLLRQTFTPRGDSVDKRKDAQGFHRPWGIYCESASDRGIVNRQYSYVDLTRSHFVIDLNRTVQIPLEDDEQLYSIEDVLQTKNLLHPPPYHRIHRLDAETRLQLRTRLRQHLTSTSPPCQMEARPSEYPTELLLPLPE